MDPQIILVPWYINRLKSEIHLLKNNSSTKKISVSNLLLDQCFRDNFLGGVKGDIPISISCICCAETAG